MTWEELEPRVLALLVARSINEDHDSKAKLVDSITVLTSGIHEIRSALDFAKGQRKTKARAEQQIVAEEQLRELYERLGKRKQQLDEWKPSVAKTPVEWVLSYLIVEEKEERLATEIRLHPDED